MKTKIQKNWKNCKIHLLHIYVQDFCNHYLRWKLWRYCYFLTHVWLVWNLHENDLTDCQRIMTDQIISACHECSNYYYVLSLKEKISTEKPEIEDGVRVTLNLIRNLTVTTVVWYGLDKTFPSLNPLLIHFEFLWVFVLTIHVFSWWTPEKSQNGRNFLRYLKRHVTCVEYWWHRLCLLIFRYLTWIFLQRAKTSSSSTITGLE